MIQRIGFLLLIIGILSMYSGCFAIPNHTKKLYKSESFGHIVRDSNLLEIYKFIDKSNNYAKIADCIIETQSNGDKVISSHFPAAACMKSLRINLLDNVKSDSVQLYIKLPQNSNDYIVGIQNGTGLFRLKKYVKNISFTLPKNYRVDNFIIKPIIDPFNEHTSYGDYMSLAYIKFSDLKLILNDHNIELNIDSLDNNIFNRWWIDHEYIIIDHDKILWRDQIFTLIE